jgi:hypothetical protein
VVAFVGIRNGGGAVALSRDSSGPRC